MKTSEVNKSKREEIDILNRERAYKAWRALFMVYDADREDMEDAAVDLLTDLFHFVNLESGMAVDDLIRRAKAHYEEETNR